MVWRRWSWRNRREGLALVAVLLCAPNVACSSTVREVEQTTPVTVHRRKLAAEAPSLASSWRLTPNNIEGHIAWQQCEREESWTTKRTRVTRTPGTRNAGLALVGVSSLLTVASVATYPEPVKHCGVYGCTYSDPDTTTTKALGVSALVLLTGGIVMMVFGGRTEVETFADEPKQVRSTGPCVLPSELADLVLVLKVGRDLWPMRLEANGDVRVLIPDGAKVPTGVDLEVVVYRAPAGAGDLPLSRGQVLKTLRLDATPAPAKGPPTTVEGRADFPLVPP